MSNRFVELFDRAVRGAVRGSRERAQFLLPFNRHREVQIDSVAHFLGEGFAAQLSAPGQAALLFWVDMNQRCGDAASYITPMSYRAEQSAERGGKRLQQQRFLLGEDGAEVKDQAVFFDAGDDGDACGGAA